MQSSISSRQMLLIVTDKLQVAGKPDNCNAWAVRHCYC